MEYFVKFFFSAQNIPDLIVRAAQGYPFDLVCFCSLPAFLIVLVHFMTVASLLRILFTHRHLERDQFFSMLLTGIFFSSVASLLDWYPNVRSVIGSFSGIYFSFPVDITATLFRFIGIVILFYGICTTLFSVHHGAPVRRVLERAETAGFVIGMTPSVLLLDSILKIAVCVAAIMGTIFARVLWSQRQSRREHVSPYWKVFVIGAFCYAGATFSDIWTPYFFSSANLHYLLTRMAFLVGSGMVLIALRRFAVDYAQASALEQQ